MMFNVGDIVVGNALADDEYNITRRGSLVVVMTRPDTEGDFEGKCIQCYRGEPYLHRGKYFGLNTKYFELDRIEENE